MKRRRGTHRRGRTRPGRMRLADRFLAQSHFTLPAQQLRVVDLGYGDSLVSTIELAQLLLERCENLELSAIESDPLRVRMGELERASLEPRLAKSISVREGGFELHRLGLRGLHLVRCFNVLRGYGQKEALDAQRMLCSQLLDGGLLIEGTSDTEGHRLCCHIWQRSNSRLVYGGLLMATDFSKGFSPRMFRDVLPRDLRRSCQPKTPIFDLLSRWEQVVNARREPRSAHGPQEAPRALNREFASSVQQLSNDPTTPISYFPLPSLDGLDLRPGGAGALWRPQGPSHLTVETAPGEATSGGRFSFRFDSETPRPVLTWAQHRSLQPDDLPK